MTEFVAALRANPNYFTVPVGYKVVSESSWEIEGPRQGQSTNVSIYLNQNRDSYFVLSGPQGREKLDLELYNRLNREFLINGFGSSDIDSNIVSISKKSQSEFVIMTENSSEGEVEYCEHQVDLAKSSFLTGNNICKDKDGRLISQWNISSVEPVQLSDYVDHLKATKLRLYLDALNCYLATEESRPASSRCNTMVVDEEERDWSYILKLVFR